MAGAIDKVTIERRYEKQKRLGVDSEQLLEWLYLEFRTARLTNTAHQWVQGKLKELEESVGL